VSSERATYPAPLVRTSRGLGIVILGGRAVVLMPEGTPAPFSRSRVFTTVTDGQRAVEIRVVACSGERPMYPPVARFLLAGIRRGARGQARIEIGLSLQADGLLHAWAAEFGGMAREEVFFPGIHFVDGGSVDSLVSLMDRVCQDWPAFSPAGQKRHEAEEIREWLTASLAGSRGEEARVDVEGERALQTLAGEMASVKGLSSVHHTGERPSTRGNEKAWHVR
jgi:molecular chaperone DnaK (HSP70)